MPRLASLLAIAVLVGCGAPGADTSAPAEKAPAEGSGGGSDAKPAGSAAKADTAMTPVVFNVDGAPVVEFDTPGMHCSACAAKIVKALQEQPGVVDAKADADKKVVAVAVEKAEFDPATVIAAVEEAGFGEATQITSDES